MALVGESERRSGCTHDRVRCASVLVPIAVGALEPAYRGTCRHRESLTSGGSADAGVEPLDHPSEGELLAYARAYFKRIDQLGLGEQQVT